MLDIYVASEVDVDKIKNIGDCACFLCGKKRAYCENDELIEFMRQPIFGYDIVKINDINEIDDDIFNTKGLAPC